MKTDELETVYQAVARQLSELGSPRAEIFLAKLVLLLANELPSAEVVLQLLSRASQNLDAKYHE